jgi:hypothetical protein
MAPLYKSQRVALHHQTPTLQQYKITSTKQMISSPRPHHVKSQCKINIQRAKQVLSYSNTDLANSVASFCFANGTHLVCSILKPPCRSQFFVNTQRLSAFHMQGSSHIEVTHATSFQTCIGAPLGALISIKLDAPPGTSQRIPWHHTWYFSLHNTGTTHKHISARLEPHLLHQFAQNLVHQFEQHKCKS